MSSTKPSRPRGRPRNSDGSATAERLVQAAAAICAERGLGGCTLTRIAAEADVHPTAIYNHFAGRDDLLYAVAVRALDQLTRAARGATSGTATFTSLAATYLRPDMTGPRHILAEIHVASRRNEHLGRLIGEWHRDWTTAMLPLLSPADPEPRATVQTLFLLLLGLCHVDELAAVGATRDGVVDRVEHVVEALLVARDDGHVTQR